jgi:hypothetical protein
MGAVALSCSSPVAWQICYYPGRDAAQETARGLPSVRVADNSCDSCSPKARFAALGGAPGLFVAHGGTQLLLACPPSNPFPFCSTWPDLRVLGFTSAVCAFTGILGLAPALCHAAELTATLKEQAGNVGAGASRLALNHALVVDSLRCWYCSPARTVRAHPSKLRSIDTGFARIFSSVPAPGRSWL